MGGVSAGAVYDIIFSTRASLRRMRTCLLAFHVTEEYRHDDVIIGGGGRLDGHLQRAAGVFPGSMSDDVTITGGRKDVPEHLLSANEEDVDDDVIDDDVNDYMTKDESRSTLDGRKTESSV